MSYYNLRRTGRARTTCASLDDVLQALDLGAQRNLVLHLGFLDSIHLRSTCRRAREVVDYHLASADVRFRAPSINAATSRGSRPQATSAEAGPSTSQGVSSATPDSDTPWWTSTYAPNLRAALCCMTKWQQCSTVRIEICVCGFSESIASTALFAAPFEAACATDRLALPHVTSLELIVAFPPPVPDPPKVGTASPDPAAGPAALDQTTPLLLSSQLATALAALFPNLQSLSLSGPWASPEIQAITLNSGVDVVRHVRLINQRLNDARAALSALGPSRLPALRRLSAPYRVAQSRFLHRLSQLTHLAVSCEDMLASTSLRQNTFLNALQVVRPWVTALPSLQDLELLHFTVSYAVGFASVRPPRLQRFALRHCSIEVERRALDVGRPHWGQRIASLVGGDMVFDWSRGTFEFGSAACGFLEAARIVMAVAVPLRFGSVRITNMNLGSEAYVRDETPARAARAWQILEAYSADGLEAFPSVQGRGLGPFDGDLVFANNWPGGAAAGGFAAGAAAALGNAAAAAAAGAAALGNAAAAGAAGAAVLGNAAAAGAALQVALQPGGDGDGHGDEDEDGDGGAALAGGGGGAVEPEVIVIDLASDDSDESDDEAEGNGGGNGVVQVVPEPQQPAAPAAGGEQAQVEGPLGPGEGAAAVPGDGEAGEQQQEQMQQHGQDVAPQQHAQPQQHDHEGGVQEQPPPVDQAFGEGGQGQIHQDQLPPAPLPREGQGVEQPLPQGQAEAEAEAQDGGDAGGIGGQQQQQELPPEHQLIGPPGVQGGPLPGPHAGGGDSGTDSGSSDDEDDDVIMVGAYEPEIVVAQGAEGQGQGGAVPAAGGAVGGAAVAAAGAGGGGGGGGGVNSDGEEDGDPGVGVGVGAAAAAGGHGHGQGQDAAELQQALQHHHAVLQHVMEAINNVWPGAAAAAAAVAAAAGAGGGGGGTAAAAAVPAGPVPRPAAGPAIRLGSVTCDTQTDSLLNVVRLLQRVGPCEQLEVLGANRYQAMLAVLEQLVAQVPRHRLPGRLVVFNGYGYSSANGPGSLGPAMPLEVLWDALGRWRRLESLVLMGTFVSPYGVGDLAALLMASWRVFSQPRPNPADLVPAAAGVVPAPAAVLAPIPAAGVGAGAAAVPFRVDVHGEPPVAEAGAAAAAGGDVGSGWCAVSCNLSYDFEKGEPGFRALVAALLDALPRGMYLHAGRCGSHHSRSYTSCAGHVWLHVGPLRRDDLRLTGGSHRVHLKYMGAGRR